MELAGLEPATSRVRCGLPLDPIRPKFAAACEDQLSAYNASMLFDRAGFRPIRAPDAARCPILAGGAGRLLLPFCFADMELTR